MYIFNRWGEQLFESRDPEVGWDGTLKEEFVPTGGYSYLIYYKGAKSKGNEVKKGMIVAVK